MYTVRSNICFRWAKTHRSNDLSLRPLVMQIAALEKQNQELQWQVSMLARDPETPPMPPRLQQQQLPAIFQEAAGAPLLSKSPGALRRGERLGGWWGKGGEVLSCIFTLFKFLMTPACDVIEGDRSVVVWHRSESCLEVGAGGKSGRID